MISCVSDALSIETHDVSIDAVLEAIRTGGKKLRSPIEAIRQIFQRELAAHGDHAKAKLAVSDLKKQLPAAMWCGRFVRRANESLVDYSGLICADLDLLGERLGAAREKLTASPYLFALFLSPTGDGLKAVFRVPSDASKHLGSFLALQKHVLELSGIEIDEKSKDLARLCFMSLDPDIYVNEKAVEIEPLPEPEKPRHDQAKGEPPPDLPLRERIATELLGPLTWSPEKRGHFCRCPGQANHTNTTGEKHTIVYLDGVPTVDCQHESCRRIVEAFNVQLRSLIAKAEYQARARDSKPSEPGGEAKFEEAEKDREVTSLTSLGAAEYPAPLKKAAFHGLAGKIVRRISPHTEADEAALLIQTLTMFGSVIGCEAHAMADGSRHGMNLFSVTVGETSKSRKGTSLAHVLRIFRRVDENWARDCIGKGLSSGEGIIWAVRDPIKKTFSVRKPEKKAKRKKAVAKVTAEAECGLRTVIKDAGVDDKRLCVIEEEFAQVLKVMSREGNTLSPVIRCAWDDGNLRSMTKNSPARATGAHVSIIAHITRAELPRLLTETESANGFANRFPFVAVRRSKVLPEGGDISSENLNDLVMELHKAVEFARNAGEITRSNEARELWARVYPALSAGKPGLLGAIVARAEAQVLRLSVIYALLDCSTKVEVEHLRAALALWRYCEDSARWIFQTRTGNRLADQILAALKVAGEKGLPKWQIITDVCNRNSTKFEIDEALRALHSQRLAVRKEKKTRTKPAECWFFNKEASPYEEYEEFPAEAADTSYSSCTSPSENANSHASSAKPGSAAGPSVVGDESDQAQSEAVDL
jgi:hypothetical protein